jgi:cell division protein FtsQ
MKKIKKIVFWSLLALYFPVILGLVSSHREDVVCGNVVVEVTDSLDARFVSKTEIRKAILRKYSETLGEPLNATNFENVELFVEKHAAIKNCEVYSTVGGILKIELAQHMPLFRVFENNRSYYINEDGNEMPLFDNFTARVLIVSGAIKGQMEHLQFIARLFRADPFWEAQMEQLYLILMGQPERIEEKLRNLKALYKTGLSPCEWNNYQTINLKYKGQVLCSKNRNI